MFVFSVTATAKKTMDDIVEGQEVPFIVYVNFQDLFGAEQLAQIYLMRAGFTKIQMEDRKFIKKDVYAKPKVLQQDKHLAEAVEHGYSIQMYDEH